MATEDMQRTMTLLWRDLNSPMIHLLAILWAIPISILITSILNDTSPSSYLYSGDGLFRECAKWDPVGHRFLASTFSGGGVVEIHVGGAKEMLEERRVVEDGDVRGSGSLGLVVDGARGRLLVVYGDLIRGRYAAVGAYRLDSWDRIFLTQLAGSGDERSLADDVAVDHEGNAYITDAKSSKIWKVGVHGELLSVIRNDLFAIKGWHRSFVALNGIVYHPNGYLLVIHTASGSLFKVYPSNEEVRKVKVKGSFLMGDGLELISANKLVSAGAIVTRLVESDDDWETARVTGRYVGQIQRIASAATVKDDKVYINHLVGGGIRKRTHVIAEAHFTPFEA